MSIIMRVKTGCAGLMIAAVMAVGAPAFAQEPSESHLAAAHQAISALHATDEFDAILLNAALQLKTNLIQATPDIQVEIDQTVDEVALSLASRRGDLEKEAAAIYAKTFTEEELTAIADFYKSGAGLKLLENGPLVTRELLKAAEIWSNGIQRDMAQTVATQLHEKLGDRPKLEEAAPQAQ